MQETQASIFDSEVDNFIPLRRKDLLPLWIKAFNWVFMVLAGFSVLILIAGIFGATARLAIYGLATNDPVSLMGLSMIGIMILNGITGYGLWSEKDWGVNVAMACAFVGMVVCIYTMIYLPSANFIRGLSFSFRFELFVLFIFMRKLLKIRNEWDTRVGQ